jgi:hypothetical protein
MNQASGFFIAQPGKPLPRLESIEKLNQDREPMRKSMILQEYTLCEVSGGKAVQELGSFQPGKPVAQSFPFRQVIRSASRSQADEHSVYDVAQVAASGANNRLIRDGR